MKTKIIFPVFFSEKEEEKEQQEKLPYLSNPQTKHK